MDGYEKPPDSIPVNGAFDSSETDQRDSQNKKA
jgi:hypothetical protein